MQIKFAILFFCGIFLVVMQNMVDNPLVMAYMGDTIYEQYVREYLITKNINKKVNDLDVADKVTVQLLTTDPDARPKDRIIKKRSRYRKSIINLEE